MGKTSRIDPELERRIAALEEEQRAGGDLLRRVLVKVGITGDDAASFPAQDQPVVCRCGALAGYYDADTEIVRVRHQSHLVYMRMGPGGSISVACRKCAAMVELTYREPDDAGAVEVRNGLLVLDVRSLSKLLSAALESGSGQVTLKAITTA